MNAPSSHQCWSVLRVFLVFILGAAFIIGCSNGQMAGVGTGGTGGNQYAMGGAIQGKALSLTNAVTTIAGSTSTVAGTAGSADGTGAGARFSHPTAITSDGTNLYVADSNNCLIRKIDIATGTVTTLAGTVGVSGWSDGIGTSAKFYNPQGITNDGANLYVSDVYTIRKIEIATGKVTTLAGSPGNPGSDDGNGTTAKFNWPIGITTDGTNLYVTDSVNSTIRKIVISTGTVSTLAGAAGSFGWANGTGAAARFSNPYGITTDGTNLYVTDSGNNWVRKIVIASGDVTTLAGGFSWPTGITTDGVNLYVADTHNNMIRKIVISNGAITTLAGTYTQGSVDGSGVAANFGQPQGVTTDGTHLYVADTQNNTIRKIEISSGSVTTLAGSADADGIGTAASFFEPTGITTDGANLYVTDCGSNMIRKIIIATGEVTTLAGAPSEPSWADGTGAAARFAYPQGITTDGTYLYVVDGSFTIRKIKISTGVVTTLAGTANSWGAVDGIGTSARFYAPYGITTDGANLYVTDSGNRTIRKIEISTGMVTTLAGTAGITGAADGIGAAASFSDQLIGITTDGTNLYVADSYSIRKIVISTGAVTTLAGTVGSLGSVDGVGAAASFYLAKGITTDGTNLYVTDSDGTIRKVVISSGAVTTLAGTPWSIGFADGTGAKAKFNLPYGITNDGTSLYVTDFGNNVIRAIH